MAFIFSTALSIPTRLDKSADILLTFGPKCATDDTNLVSSLPIIITLLSRDKSFAMANPTPDEPPVMTIFFMFAPTHTRLVCQITNALEYTPSRLIYLQFVVTHHKINCDD